MFILKGILYHHIKCKSVDNPQKKHTYTKGNNDIKIQMNFKSPQLEYNLHEGKDFSLLFTVLPIYNSTCLTVVIQ